MLGVFFVYIYIGIFGMFYWLGVLFVVVLMVVFGGFLDSLVMRLVVG